MDELRRAWRQIEDMGFDWISVWDHFYAAAPPWEQPSFEATVAHAALAMETSRVRVGCLVYSAGYRHPGVQQLLLALFSDAREQDLPGITLAISRAHRIGLIHPDGSSGCAKMVACVDPVGLVDWCVHARRPLDGVTSGGGQFL